MVPVVILCTIENWPALVRRLKLVQNSFSKYKPVQIEAGKLMPKNRPSRFLHIKNLQDFYVMGQEVRVR